MKKSSSTHRTRGLRRWRRRPLGGYRYVRLRWRVLFAAVDAVGYAVFAILRRLATLGKTTTGEAPEPRAILLVQLDHLGDAIITTAMLPALRDRYPQARIEVLAGAWNQEVFAGRPEVDRLHVSRANRFARGCWSRWAWMASVLWWGWRLRGRQIDLAIDVRGEFPLAVICWLTGARRRVGWACGGGGFLLTDSVRFVAGRPEVESRRAILETLGIESGTIEPRWAVSGESRRALDCKLQIANCRLQIEETAYEVRSTEYGVRRPSEPETRTPYSVLRTPPFAPRPSPLAPRPSLLVFHISAGTPAKQWPIEHWRELLGRVAAEHDATIILVGGSGDRRRADAILDNRAWPGVVDWTGRFSLRELAAVIQRADVFVGADSGPAHLAAAVGTPAVVLFSGTNRPRQWQPRGQCVTVLRHRVACSPCHRERCRLAEHPCMWRLLPERVAATTAKELENAPRQRTTRSSLTLVGSS